MSFQKVVKNGPANSEGDHQGAIIGEWPLEPTTDHLPSSARKSTAPASRAQALQVRDLGKTFRSGFLRRLQRGISGISFDVFQGEVFALLGHNGAGKTTTINCILDLVRADSGEVKILGKDHRDQTSRVQVGYLPERPYFFEHLTGRELLDFYAALLGVPGSLRKARIEEVLEMTGMTGSAGRRLRKYSKGMLQRIGLAQALLGDPQLLILDEPMSGLDPMGRRQVRKLLQELKNRGKTIILSSHIVPDVEMLADRVGVIREGALVMTRKLDEISENSIYEIQLQDEAAGGRCITAENTEALRQILDRCHDDGIIVTGVQQRRSGLEDFFLEAHQITEDCS